MNAIITLTEETCCSCFVHFAMDATLQQRRLSEGGAFYCPNGHRQYYTETEVTRLKKLNANLNKRLGWAEETTERVQRDNRDLKNQKAAIKGQLTKTRRRIANGVCPCCNRSFSNVARHMVSKHPEFKEAVS